MASRVASFNISVEVGPVTLADRVGINSGHCPTGISVTAT